MRRPLCIALGLASVVAMAWAASGLLRAADQPAAKQRVFELRVYVTNPGKLEALHKRFREHTNRLFQRHGIELVGYWTPAEGPESENTLIYIVAFPSREAQAKSWAAFKADPEWQKAYKESHKDGVIVKEIKSTTMVPTDYSPIR
ncbi:MAG: NIPSNAP family protein [Thermoguttaceae bacterium]